MRFTPKSADEIAEAGLLPDGDYGFEVAAAEDAVSKSGNEMVVLTLKVFDEDDGARTIKDYLVATDGGMRKVRGFAVACGLLAEYEAGSLEADDMIGRAGKVKIRTDKNPGYEPKNGVAFYLDRDKQSFNGSSPRSPVRMPISNHSDNQRPGDLDDEIPF